jgi:SpoVK/Ycf46/Vps4 family AAA+-type ATPase
MRYMSRHTRQEPSMKQTRDPRSTRLVSSRSSDNTWCSPALDAATSLDVLCVRFALRTVTGLGAKFNLRRDVNNLVTLAARYWVWPEPVLLRLRDFLGKRCAESPAWLDVSKLNAQEFIDRHGVWNGLYDDSTFYYYIDEFVKIHGKELGAVFSATLAELDHRLAKVRVRLLDNIAMLSAVLGLSDAETSVLQHASLCKYQRDLRPVLVDCKASSAQEAYGMLAQVLNLQAGEVGAALKVGGRLEALGLIETPIAEHSITDLGDLMRVSDKLLAVLTADYASESSMMAAFTRPAEPTKLAMEDFPHVSDDARYLIAMLQAAAKQQERGINVLIYGAPGTGKTEFAKLVAAQAGLELYEVDCLDKDGSSLNGRERYRSLQVSQAFLKGRSQAAILFDEVEDVFPPIGAELAGLLGTEEPRGSVNGKAWVNQTLERNPVPTLWISNAIGQIDPAYRRRFQFHLELANPPQKVRETIARKHLGQLGVSEAFIAAVAARASITPAQIEAATRFARLASTSLPDDLEGLVVRQLDRADKALGNVSTGRGEFRVNVTQYKLDLLNVECRYPVGRIIDSLRERPRATLCFYGLPGTGKTALAEHIAKTLEKPLIIKLASDLMSKYVGETEQKMAAMFEQAQREDAVLLLDEADSFLQNRALAQRNYEVSEVNEMLAGMERFDGIFICTTNLFDRIDEAALRRFAFKIRFLQLTREQRRQMFVSEVLNGEAGQLTDAVLKVLDGLEYLTPGDFATVKRQYVLLNDTPQAEDFVEQLKKEHAVKSDVRYSRPVGFTH